MKHPWWSPEYERDRSARKRAVRAHSTPSRMSRVHLQLLRDENALIEERRPPTRGECPAPGEPCPFVSCKYHLYVDVNPLSGSMKVNFPDLEPWELKETCTLDVAARGGETLETVAELMNLTRERARQLEESALRKMRALRSMQEYER
jgi:hypothetical protein